MQPIPTYIINLKKRTERKEHILLEFSGRAEFSPRIVEAQEREEGALGLWLTIRQIIQEAVTLQQAYIILCEDDHTFLPHYQASVLHAAIAEADARQADILSGGVSWFNNALPVSDTLYWVEKFSGMQFTIIFSRFFQPLLDVAFTTDDAADTKTSHLTDNKYFIYPFISGQREFGYSDVTPRNNREGRVSTLFDNSLKKAGAVKYICEYYRQLHEKMVTDDTATYDGISIPTFVISLPGGPDRQAHVQQQFRGRSEFSIVHLTAHRQENGGPDLWRTFREIIATAHSNEDDVIIICQDSHLFTAHYSRDYLLRNIIEAYRQGTTLLSGMVNEFDIAVPVTTNRFWLNSLSSLQFLVVYKSIFQKILQQETTGKMAVHRALSDITSYKMVLFPFISAHKDFSFNNAVPRLQLARRIYDIHRLK
ncbi:hypothetical protein ECE50_003360 [Chitinophaga sp. Mgbs1]|uniref:Uncharacterized protein n=1 Tax=Chitinophaga solisilvae TaxID=1233460 RepID=A0A3S1D2S2_9BACT|nr:hypothetical protein [Chitinophaga solisilvae]